MSSFNHIYQSLIEGNIPSIFKSPIPDELTDRRKRWKKIQVDEWMKGFNKRDDKRLVNGRWDVDGDVNISEMNFSKLPVKFGKVGGYFDCGRCTSLTSLEGAPTYVGVFFDCYGCTSLTSLEGSPTSVVVGNFSCGGCTSLTSLEGAPTSVGGEFCCYGCGKKFTVDDVKLYSKVKETIHV